MKRVELGIEETLKYKRSMVVSIPIEMTEDDLNRLLDDVQNRSERAEEIPVMLEKLDVGIKVIKIPCDDMASPWRTEVEIDELDIIDY